MTVIETGSLPVELAQHRAYTRVFQPGRLTFGFIAPLEGYPDSPAPPPGRARSFGSTADELGFAVIWLRDVPFLDPAFGDVGQIHDPMVYAGWLAANTRDISIGTAGMVMTLCDPVLLAKQATSVDQLSGGRLLLGLTGPLNIRHWANVTAAGGNATGIPMRCCAPSPKTHFRRTGARTLILRYIYCLVFLGAAPHFTAIK